MIKEHRRTLKILRLSFDLTLVTALYYALYAFTLHVANPLGLVLNHPDYAWRLPLVLLLCWAFAFISSGIYDRTRLSSLPVYAATTALRVLLLMLLTFALGLFAFKIQFLSRKFLAVYAVGSFGLLVISKLLELRLLAALRGVGYNTLSVVLVGEGEGLWRLSKAFEGNKEWGYRLVGLLAERRPARLPAGLRYLGHPKKLAEILRTRIVDELVLALPLGRQAGLEPLLVEARQAGLRVRLLLPESLQGWAPQLDPLGGFMDTLDLHLRRRQPYALMLKSLLEWCLALLAFVLLLPVMLLVALLVLLSMGGPVLFVQKRAGTNGRVFNLYKFRTMIPDARSKQGGLQARNEMRGPVFKLKQDPRITPLGRFLRRSSLDELPQLWNVLRGDLALVGPRAMAQYEARKVPAWAQRRFSVKPGVTCLREVSGRSELSFEQWMRSDLEYLDRWSLGLDAQILLKTLPAVLSSRGAY
jgi:exopolysaccharide biosynthesis polyprenyl glycosylphosphotransferase